MFMKRMFIASTILGTVLAAPWTTADATMVSIDPKATYLRTYDDSGAQDTVPLLLADYGIAAGDWIFLVEQGDFNNGPDGDIYGSSH